jgi:hypothetical protein
MTCSRRGFLGGLLAVVSAPAIVRVENLMPINASWIIPDPVILSHAGKQVVLAPAAWIEKNSLLTIEQITREAVRLFTNSNAFIKSIDEQYDREFAADQARIGSQLRVITDAAKFYSYNSAKELAEIQFGSLQNKTPWITPA